eukprot:2283075-Rhodomonas_salina.1
MESGLHGTRRPYSAGGYGGSMHSPDPVSAGPRVRGDNLILELQNMERIINSLKYDVTSARRSVAGARNTENVGGVSLQAVFQRKLDEMKRILEILQEFANNIPPDARSIART